MENEEYCCIDCAKQLECWGPDIKLDDPDLYIPINCIDYQDMDELFNS
ncbi:demethylase [Phocaeicola vulgatus]|nr:demethylase [Phocaeicola vulgatus]NMW69136.1 demethylase [Phocaeicola vulgatus]